jgi:tRNA A-37 threonylcarbamoyl transferase component Bud32
VDAHDLSGTVLDGRYKVIAPLSEGAMGSVYRGERLQLGRAVAIKVMHEALPDELSSRQRFEREAKLMAMLEHPHCVSVIDFGVHDEKPYLVMEYVRGTSLQEVLEKEHRLDIPRAAKIVEQVLSGLGHAHELGIIHRDIKPANIMVTSQTGLGEQVRILDFGLARLAEGSTKLTTGIVVGTPNYMAPEQCKGGDIDARTDLYACGVMLFEMLTGRKPFLADDPLQVVRKHLLEPPPTMHAVEPRVDFGELEAVVAKALAKSPGERYESAVEMSKAVEVAAAKHVKTSAAALFARAVPESAATVGSQQATMSGWNVPQAGGAGTQMLTDSMMLPADASGTAPMAGPPSGPTPMGAPPAPTGPGGLPALPQAGPYVPPPGVGATGAPNAGAPEAHGMMTSAPFIGTASPVAGSDPAFASNGAPAAALNVPPTRPSTVQPGGPARPAEARPIPQLPLTKKQLMIGGGGLLALLLIIAIAASGGDKKKATTAKTEATAGSSQPHIEMPDDEAAPGVIEKAKALIASEDYDGAVRVLRPARKKYADNAEIAFLAGKAYFGQLYWTDGIDSFRAAIKLDSSYKENPELLKTVLKGFLTTPDIDDRIVGFMRRDIGPPMRKYLEETAEKHPNKSLRARAKSELNAR